MRLAYLNDVQGGAFLLPVFWGYNAGGNLRSVLEDLLPFSLTMDCPVFSGKESTS